MFKNGRYFLIVGSVALNIAFTSAWLVYAIPASFELPETPSSAASTGAIWCPLHRELDVTPEQWRQIEPRLKDFRHSAESACQRFGQLRLEMLDLIAAATTDTEAIAAKQDEILAGQRKVQELVIGQLLAEKEVLTPEQAARLFAMIRVQGGCERSGSRSGAGRGRGGFGRVLRESPGDN
jgi:Spy/CpxP family protein refolding chaperone